MDKTPVSASDSLAHQTHYAPPSGPPPGHAQQPDDPQLSQGAVISRQAHDMHQTGGRVGMQAGMLAGIGDRGGNMVGDMIEGQVVGNLVGQQIGQAKKHAYYREQALNYQAGLPADGASVPPGTDPNSREAKRAEKRAKRWERRGHRKDKIKNLFGGGKSSSSESEKD